MVVVYVKYNTNSIQVPAVPDGTGGDGEAGESPALTRNCNSSMSNEQDFLTTVYC